MNPTPPTTPAQSLAPTARTEVQAPWWRVPMVWVVISGPLSVVLACAVTAVFAWKHIDPVIKEGPQPVATSTNPKEALAPAIQARNHAASPER